MNNISCKFYLQFVDVGTNARDRTERRMHGTLTTEWHLFLVLLLFFEGADDVQTTINDTTE